MENSNKFTQAIKFVLEAEGGYVNDPKDPGGETNYQHVGYVPGYFAILVPNRN